MRSFLRYSAMAVALLTGVAWLITGAHRGWTQTSVPVTELDEVTGIEAIRYERRLVLGVDFLAGGALAAGLLASTSYVLSARKKPC